MLRPRVNQLGRFLALMVSTMGTNSLRAHSDPSGEVHPVVVAREKGFEVYFLDNREPHDSQPGQMYRSTYSLDGTEVTHRELFEGNIPDNGELTVNLDMGDDGLPFFEFRPNEGGHEIHRFPLPQNSYCDSRVLSWHSRYEMVVRFSPASQAHDASMPFSLGLFDLRTDQITRRAEIGILGRIYEYAVTSPVLRNNEEFYLAWIESKLLEKRTERLRDGTTSDFSSMIHRVILSRWNPASGKVTHLEISRALSDNVALSVAAHGERLMVAWHDMGLVRTGVVNLQSGAFVEKLPPLQRDQEAESLLFHGARSFSK